MLVALLLFAIQSTALADDVTYGYDALGRLIKVERSDGTQTVYSLDAAGNRVEVQEAIPPGVPATISVPASSTTGAFTISWSAPSTGTVQSYELYESTSSGFSSQTRIYSGAGTSKVVSGKGDGTYYYRVRACGVECSGYRAGANGVVVTLPPTSPSSITFAATSNTGSYTVSWGESTGSLTAYELYESTSSTFGSQTRVYNSTGTSVGLSGRGDGSYYYRVRACNGTNCSGYAAGTHALSVLLPPGTPASISVPTGSNSGSYTVSWGTSSGSVSAYELYQATNASFSGATLVYSGTGTGFNATGRGNGTYYYRVRACNTNCSGYATGANATVVTLPPGAPAYVSTPSSSVLVDYKVSWAAASGTLSAYELYEATNASFSGAIQLYSGTGTIFSVVGRPNGTYYYRVRACNGSACSSFTTAWNPTTVTMAPGTPASISVPSSSANGSYPVSWSTASGEVTAYELYEATHWSFSTQSLIYSSTGTSTSVSGRGNGTYYYRVRACYAGVCSGYTAYDSIAVTLPPGAPANIYFASTSSTGSYTVSWGTASGQVTSYELWQATNASFSGETRVYSGTGQATVLGSRLNGSYYYRVRACNAGYCGSYTTASHAIVVTLPASSPPAPTGLWSSQSSQCSWQANWSASPGATSYVVRDSSGYFQQTVTNTSVSYSFCSAPGYTGNPMNYKPKWVQACSSDCSLKVNFP